MGGSILGSKAIHTFFENKIKKNFTFVDDLDEKKINNILKFKAKALFIFISKSGNTIEILSIINFLDKKINKNNTIIITEDENNELNNYAKKNKIFRIKHKNFIGGRYSVLSEVGMVPAYLMGLNVSKINYILTTLLHHKF